MYDPEATGDITDADRLKLEAGRKELVAEWDKFDAHEQVFKRKLEEAYDAQYFDALHDDILDLTHVYVSDMLDHLEDQCLGLTNDDKTKKLEETHQKWDQNDDITQYFLKLDKLDIELQEYKIEWSTDMKITAAVKQMYKSNLFDIRDMRDWEKKPEGDKT